MTLNFKSESTNCMKEDIERHLTELLETLEHYIDVTSGFGLDLAAWLLRMAKLDLLMRLHGISDEELQALREALDDPKSTGFENKTALSTRPTIARDKNNKRR
jgi:ribosomal protein S13